MNYIVKYEDMGNTLIRTFEGIVTMDDIISSWEHIIKKFLADTDHRAIITDYTKATIKSEIGELDRLKTIFYKNIDTLKNIKISQIVDSSTIVFPILFNMKCLGFNMKVFSTMEAARLWVSY